MGYKAYKISAISREVLKSLLLMGTIYIASSSPYFVASASKKILGNKFYNSRKKRQLDNAFDYLRRNGFLEIDKDAFRVRISLTEQGKKKAGKYQINDLKIVQPAKWDKKWRVIIFDVPHHFRLQRDVFRGKLQELGFYLLQKSVWVYPYDCQKEVKLLRDFFGLGEENIRIIIAEDIGNDRAIKHFFKLP